MHLLGADIVGRDEKDAGESVEEVLQTLSVGELLVGVNAATLVSHCCPKDNGCVNLRVSLAYTSTGALEHSYDRAAMNSVVCDNGSVCTVRSYSVPPGQAHTCGQRRRCPP